ncbi:MAG: glycosyltransferase family 4 protein [Planctomycetaceae bacterium]
MNHNRSRRVHLVYDVDGWAFHGTCRDIEKYAPAGWELVSMPEAEFARLPETDLGRADAVLHFSWYAHRPELRVRQACVVANHGCEHDPWPCRGSRGSCDHGSHDWPAVAATRTRNRQAAAERLPRFDAVLCVNPLLAARVREWNPRAEFLPIGIDGEIFAPRSPLERDSSQKLRVGWCGQLDDPPFPNQKGFEWVFQPVRERCASFCEFEVNTRNYKTGLDRAAMGGWYDGIDVFLCTSISEGSPNTAMEALACGRPVVGTAVGDLPQLVRSGETGYATGTYQDADSAAQVIERSCAALRALAADRDLLVRMGESARRTMEAERNWRTLAPRWLAAITGAGEVAA